MMTREEHDVSADSVAELRGRTPNVWLILGSVLFVLAFALGWRAAGGEARAPGGAAQGEPAA